MGLLPVLKFVHFHFKEQDSTLCIKLLFISCSTECSFVIAMLYLTLTAAI